MHTWLKQSHVVFVPGLEISPLQETFVSDLLGQFQALGHVIQEQPDDQTDILITTAPFEQPISWRSSLLFTGRLRYKYKHSPTVFTLIQVAPDVLENRLTQFRRILEKEAVDPADYEFPGLKANAYKVLYEQGHRGGAILALERLLQAQSKCINILLLVGDDRPRSVIHFDLVGAYPVTAGENSAGFYQDIALRMVTRVSTHEVTEHQVVGEPLPNPVWRAAKSPGQMLEAARKLDERGFFTDMVRIYELVDVPAVSDAVSSQYSEGCFSTWDPELNALVATITGSARPVSKGSISEDDLTLIVGIRPDGQGALVRQIEGKRNDPPSSEAVEMIGMDSALPRVLVNLDGGAQVLAPVVRSRLHGHRGISAYDPEQVEFVSMDADFYHYPVTCATEAQAHGVIDTFARSQALQNPEDPRQVVFTILPTHGVVILEKWVPGTAPFQTIWEYFDRGYLVLDTHVPQGPIQYVETEGKRVLKTLYEQAILPG
jgi:hypothetical protein